MVNHFRTLLLNERASSFDKQEQYIDTRFNARKLSSGASAVRQAFISAHWPREYKNFVATQMHHLVYSHPEFALLIDAIDPKVIIEDYKLEITEHIGLERIKFASALKVIGSFHPAAADGVFSEDWAIYSQNSNAIMIVDRYSQANIKPVVFTGDTSNLIRVDDRSELFLQFVGITAVPAGLIATLAVSDAMRFDVIGTLNHLLASTEAHRIFESTKNGQVLRELQKHFFESPRPEKQLSSILTAYALRVTEDL